MFSNPFMWMEAARQAGRGQAEDVPVRRMFQPATFRIGLRSATTRQSCGARYAALTSLLKPIARWPWHGRHRPGGNSPAGAEVFRGVKWKPAGSLPGRAARGQCGSTPSLCPCVSRPPTRRPTDAAASSICIANAWCCGARCAACAWRSICRSRRFAAWRSGCTATPACLLKIPRRLDRRRARARRSGFVAAVVCFGRGRRHRRRMAVLGPRARAAVVGRRRRRQVARTVRAIGRAARRSSDLAPPPPHGERAAPAVAVPAPSARQIAAKRRAVHRGEREIIARN